eukprot:Hpha_TRINITY_DN16866_c2_g1::TRINITY_DN16866_c2_g1_i1::g.150393::m.150393
MGMEAATWNGWLWVWYACMVTVCCVGNIVLLTYAWRKTSSPESTYAKVMRVLAVPWVVNCAWRSVFVSLYLQREVFWDTILNAIIVDRGFACVGELAWVGQAALALCFIDRELTPGGRKWVQASGVLAVFIYGVAECVSYYNVATTNEFFCAVEVNLDGLSYLVMLPAVLKLLCECPKHTSARTYLNVMFFVTILYPIWNTFIYGPMYIQRWKVDQAAHKQYFTFWEGIKDAATRRIETHRLADWQQDMFWMTMYFSIGAWSGILLMWAPKVGKAAKTQPELLSEA